jgi:hypothetical protein
MDYKRRLLTMTLFGLLSLSMPAAQEAREQGQADPAGQQEKQWRAELRHRPNLSSSERARVIRGLRIAPVPLDLENRNIVLVGLGSYLVNSMGGCNDCHTNPSFAEGGNPFAGETKQVNTENYLAGGTPFFGPVVSRNLTPDPETGLPAGLTWEQFRETMRTGKDQKGLHPELSPLLQVMPWPVYQSMTDRDLRAIYAYLRAIPHAEPAPPAP